MVEKSDGTIDCISNVSKARAPAKPERVIQTWKNPHEKVRKEKAYAYVQYDRYRPPSCHQGLEDNIINVKHQFMALKRVAKLNGCHSPTVGRKYKSRYSLESRH